MSHEIETAMFVRQPAWHGLGTVLQEPPTVLEALRQAGLDWSVMEEPLYVHEGKVRGYEAVATHKALVRDTDRRVLGIVGESYTPLQNRDALGFFDAFVQKGQVTLEAAGSLRGGAMVWVLARIQTEGDVKPGDSLVPYFLLLTGHDGHTKVHLRYTEVRVVCMNTARMALGETNVERIALRHTRNVAETLEAARDTVDLARRTFSVNLDLYRALVRKDLQPEAFRKYVRAVLQVPEAEPRMPRAWEQLERLFESGPGAREAGPTAWGAYNAVTGWLDHERGTGETRLVATWLGEGARIRERALREAVVLATK